MQRIVAHVVAYARLCLGPTASPAECRILLAPSLARAAGAAGGGAAAGGAGRAGSLAASMAAGPPAAPAVGCLLRHLELALGTYTVRPGRPRAGGRARFRPLLAAAC